MFQILSILDWFRFFTWSQLNDWFLFPLQRGFCRFSRLFNLEYASLRWRCYIFIVFPFGILRWSLHFSFVDRVNHPTSRSVRYILCWTNNFDHFIADAIESLPYYFDVVTFHQRNIFDSFSLIYDYYSEAIFQLRQINIYRSHFVGLMESCTKECTLCVTLDESNTFNGPRAI